MRLVNADALLSEMEKYNDLSARYRNEYLYGMQQQLETCIELVEDAPTVDAAPVVHGQWIDKDGGIATCSVCGDRWGVWSVMKYCPNCGAKMDGKDGDGNG